MGQVLLPNAAGSAPIARCQARDDLIGSSGRIRTYNPLVNNEAFKGLGRKSAE